MEESALLLKSIRADFKYNGSEGAKTWNFA